MNPLAAFTLFAIGGYIVLFGGWKWLVPVSVFFVSASAVSGVAESHFMNPFVGKSGRRDMHQILAKGVPAVVVSFVYFATGDPRWYIVLVAIVATANGDTWGSAIGAYSRSQQVPRIPSFKLVQKGRSGGISCLGSIGSAIGVLLIVVVGMVLQPSQRTDVTVALCASALIGTLVDSALGGTVQAEFLCTVCNARTESIMHCGKKGQIVKGCKYCDGDLVNFVSLLAGGTAMILILECLNVS